MLEVGEKIDKIEEKSKSSVVESCRFVTVELSNWRMLEVRLSVVREVLETTEEVDVAVLLVLLPLEVVALISLLAALLGFSKLSRRPLREPVIPSLLSLGFSRGDCESCNILM